MLGYRVGLLKLQFMHWFWLFLFLAIAFVWMYRGLRVAARALDLPRMENAAPLPDEQCPTVSLLFAARDEQEKLPRALETLRQLDYPGLEIVAVDDRSTDATAAILADAANRDARLRVAEIKKLPPGWLGKPHALQQAFAAATGDWLLFTDADVRFRPDTIRRAMAIVSARDLDHLTLLCDVEMHGFWEKTALTFFGLGFHLANDPQAVSNPRSRAYLGVGAFQLVRRAAYEKSGTHRRLAMEVMDDMKLGKIVKQAGFRSGVGMAGDYVSVRWHAGMGNIIRGVTKNFFASAEFKLGTVALMLLALLSLSIAPFVALGFAHGWVLAAAMFSVAAALLLHGGAAYAMRASPLYALTHPLGAVIFGYMLLRSTVVTLRQGGVVWRDTFYPLDELRKGMV